MVVALLKTVHVDDEVHQYYIGVCETCAEKLDASGIATTQRYDPY